MKTNLSISSNFSSSFLHSHFVIRFSFICLTLTLAHIPIRFLFVTAASFFECSCYLIACGSFSAIGITKQFLLHTIVIVISVAFDLNGRKIVFIYAPLLLFFVCVVVLEHWFSLVSIYNDAYCECLIPFRFRTASGQ